MEDEYKLKEECEDVGFNIISRNFGYLGFFVMWISGIFVLGTMFIEVYLLHLKILFIILMIIYSVVTIGMLELFIPHYNKDDLKIQKIGKKDTAYIIDAYSRGGRIDRLNSPGVSIHYVTISYGKKIKFYKVKYNKAFRILKILLESQSYPVQKIIEISIDIYVYGNKVYADLESVDLSKVIGYDEAKQIVDKEGIE